MSAADTDSLVALARSRAPADRDRLLSALSIAGGVEPALASPAAQALLAPLFLDLVKDAERHVRLRLAERLAAAEWAPRALIRLLAADEIEIARPVIADSPLLADDDLIALLVDATLEHRIEVASRAGIAAPVSAAVIAQGDPAALTALAGNATAEISDIDMALLVEASRPLVGLRAPLSRHPRLSEALARRLYVWVGEALRGALANRFAIDAVALQAEIDSAVDEAHAEGADTPGQYPEDSERRLVAKLAAAGQLRPGYLLRALRDGRLALFEAALATLGGYSREGVRRALQREQPDFLALACAGVGIDRSVFPTVLNLVRRLNGGGPTGGGDGVRVAEAAFGPHPPKVAAAAFRQAACGV